MAKSTKGEVGRGPKSPSVLTGLEILIATAIGTAVGTEATSRLLRAVPDVLGFHHTVSAFAKASVALSQDTMSLSKRKETIYVPPMSAVSFKVHIRDIGDAPPEIVDLDFDMSFVGGTNAGRSRSDAPVRCLLRLTS